jgi:hypothetical protein
MSLVLMLLFISFSQALADETVTLPALDFARLAILQKQYDAARAILEPLAKAHPKDIEPRFLLAEISAEEGNFKDAVDRYRAILLDYPDNIRVRLDLAAALYQLGEDESATYNFQLVLADDLPDNVRENVMKFLSEIRHRKHYTINAMLSVAPDTNLNAGTGKNELTLFGLPFTTSSETQQHSGVGVVGSLFGEYRFFLDDHFRIRTNATLWRVDYPGGRFDDMIATMQVGPQFLNGVWDVSLLAVYTQRWYGNDPYNKGVGPRIEANYNGFERWSIGTTFQYLSLDYHSQTFQNGDFFDVSLYPTYFLSPTSYVWPVLGIFRTQATDDAFSNFGYRIGAGYHKELAGGITVEVGAEFLIADYDAPSSLFETTRRDRTIRPSFSIYKRNLTVLDFSPVFTYTFTDNISNQDLFAYRRHQFQIGLTKQF